MDDNKIEFGLSNVCISTYSFDLETGLHAYATPKKLYSAVSLQLDPEGEKVTNYADNGVYFEATVNDGYTGNVVIYKIPDWFYTDILGFKLDTNGVLIEDGKALPKPFALGFTIDGDSKNRKCWYYNCNIGRPSESTKTKEATIEANQKTLTISCNPRMSDDRYVKASVIPNETNELVFGTFLDTVYTPVGL
jgi:phi13 family phage major tail protein